MNHTIFVKAKRPELMPTQAHEGEWMDLALAEDVHLSEGEFKYLDLGVCIELPEGYEAIMAPRSSTFKKYNILQANGIGVIDHAYSGPSDFWKMPVYSTKDVDIPAGARIAQFRILPVQGNVNVVEVEEMENESRGGLGSTGV